jgi:GH18 family chitinase
MLSEAKHSEGHPYFGSFNAHVRAARLKKKTVCKGMISGCDNGRKDDAGFNARNLMWETNRKAVLYEQHKQTTLFVRVYNSRVIQLLFQQNAHVFYY